MRKTTWRAIAKVATSLSLVAVCGAVLLFAYCPLSLAAAVLVFALVAGIHLGLKGLEKAWRLWRFRRGLPRAATHETPPPRSRGPWLWPLCKSVSKAAIVVFVILITLEILGVGAHAYYICRNCAAYGAKRTWAPWIGRGGIVFLRPTAYTYFLGLCQGDNGHDCHDWLLCHGHGGLLGPMCMIGSGRHMLPAPLHEDETFFLFYLDSQSENLKERLCDYFRDPDAPASREFKTFFDQRYYEWRALDSARRPRITYE